MNKGICIIRLINYSPCMKLVSQICIDTVIAADHVNMGDSANVNRGKLGHVSDWNDFAKDYIMITKSMKEMHFFILMLLMLWLHIQWVDSLPCK